MRFKYWFYINEAIDANTEKALIPFMDKFTPEQREEAEKELQSFRTSPDLINRGQVFGALQKFTQKKEKPKTEEDAFRNNWNTRGSSENELKVYDYYKSENKDQLTEMMELLRKFVDKKLITIEFENNKPVLFRNVIDGKQELDTPDFTRFMSQLHGIESSLTKFKANKQYFNPIEEELNHLPNLVAKGDNIWVFKGHVPDVCRIYGKNQVWCISSSKSATSWFDYRIGFHQTQYFVFDFNKDEDDPARYVNPGVAPPGKYSEWVDANNRHSKDPEDPNSHFGINGYKSINEYKRYLASKNIPLDTWQTTPPEDWEERLFKYCWNNDFKSAKNDSNPKVFPMYLEIATHMHDYDFEKLDKEQKIKFVMGKFSQLTDQQKKFVKTNIKKSDYYSSLHNFEEKIKAAGHFEDEPSLQKIASMYEISDSDVNSLISYAKNEDQMAKIIIDKKLEYIFNGTIFNLIKPTIDEEQKYNIAELVINNNPEIIDVYVKNMLNFSDEQKTKEKIAELLINKKKELHDKNIEDLTRSLFRSKEKLKFVDLIMKNKPELSDIDVNNIMVYLSTTDPDKIAEKIINSKPYLGGLSVASLLFKAENKDKIAELLQKDTDNISKISAYILNNFFNTTEKIKVAQILNKYHKNKTPEIQNIIDRYLYEDEDA